MRWKDMAERYVNVDRLTPMLLPPDLRDWVADNDLAKLILEAVELCDLASARRNPRGSGSAQYPPGMMLALLIYCYATGVLSSRQIERATYDSVAVRYLCGNHHPDHDTIATFRRTQSTLFQECFAKVLFMAREAGVLKLGAISLDGTRLAGASSPRSVRTLAQLEQEIQALEAQAAELMGQAEQADQLDLTGGGLQLPPDLAQTETRLARLRAAREQIDRRRAQAQADERPKGRGSAHQTSCVSVSEPESRRLRRGASGGAVQGYNAQVAVDAGQSGLIVGQFLSDEPADNRLVGLGVACVAPAAGQPSVVLVDKGYESTELIAAVEAAHRVIILCPPRQLPPEEPKTKRRSARRQRIVELRAERQARLEVPGYQRLYQRRGVTVEPVFARLKQHMGFRRFRCWGQRAAGAEWSLICLAHNLRLLSGRQFRR